MDGHKRRVRDNIDIVVSVLDFILGYAEYPHCGLERPKRVERGL